MLRCAAQYNVSRASSAGVGGMRGGRATTTRGKKPRQQHCCLPHAENASAALVAPSAPTPAAPLHRAPHASFSPSSPSGPSRPRIALARQISPFQAASAGPGLHAPGLAQHRTTGGGNLGAASFSGAGSMNGAAPSPPADERAQRKRALTDELVALRTQKAQVLRQIQAIAKRQKSGGLPTKASELLASNKQLVMQLEQRNRAEKVRGASCEPPNCLPGSWQRDLWQQQGGRAGDADGAAAAATVASPRRPSPQLGSAVIWAWLRPCGCYAHVASRPRANAGSGRSMFLLRGTCAAPPAPPCPRAQR